MRVEDVPVKSLPVLLMFCAIVSLLLNKKSNCTDLYRPFLSLSLLLQDSSCDRIANSFPRLAGFVNLPHETDLAAQGNHVTLGLRL